MNRLVLKFLFCIVLLNHSHALDYFAQSSSGGVSLGNYQSGRIFYQNYLIKKGMISAFPTVFTGASAGSINSLLSLIDICHKKEEKPNESIYWKAWSLLGYNKLLPTQHEGEASAIFSNRFLYETMQNLKVNWLKGMSEGCEFVLGVPITLKKPDVFQVSDSLSISRQLVTVTLKIKGRGMGRAPLIENFKDSYYDNYWATLDLGDNAEDNFHALSDLLIASGSFPGAFPPKKVRVCINKVKECSSKNSKEYEFIDGGVYENQPIKLSHSIKLALGRKKSPLEPTFFRHVDADGRGYPVREQDLDDTHQSFVTTLLKNFSNFIKTSRNHELHSFINSGGDNIKIISTVSHFPRASEPWAAFMGFFDIGFREFDFLLGMYEAELEIKKYSPGYKGLHPLTFENKDELGELGSWARFGCLKQFIEGEISLTCKDPKVKNLKILTQISLLRLFSACQTTDEWDSCKRFKDLKSPPQLSRDFENKIILPLTDEDEGTYLIKQAISLGYDFDKEEFKENLPIEFQLRKKLQLALIRLSQKQKNPNEAYAIRYIGETVMNYFTYLAPERSMYMTLGLLSEVGLTSRKVFEDFSMDKLSFNIGVNHYKITDVLKSGSSELTVAPFLGVLYPLSINNSGTIQYQFGLAGGYSFAFKDAVTTRECSKDEVVCDTLYLKPMIGMSFMNLFQLNLYARHTIFKDESSGDVHLSAGFNYVF